MMLALFRRCVPFLMLASVTSAALAQSPTPAVTNSPAATTSPSATTPPPTTAPPLATAHPTTAPSPGPMLPQGCPAPGSLQTNVSQVNALRLKGIDADEAGRYAEAINYYECALQFGSDPKILHNIAYPYEKVGRYADALTALLRFKASSPPDLLTSDLDKRIATLRNRATSLTVHANVVGARVLVRDVAVGAKPAEKPLVVWVNAGRATVEVNAEGYKRFLKEVELSPGGSHEFDVQLRPLNDTKPSVIVREVHREVAAAPFWSQWWFWAGASLLVVGGATTIYAISTEKDARSGSLGLTSGPLHSGPGSLGLRF